MTIPPITTKPPWIFECIAVHSSIRLSLAVNLFDSDSQFDGIDVRAQSFRLSIPRMAASYLFAKNQILLSTALHSRICRYKIQGAGRSLGFLSYALFSISQQKPFC